MSDSDECPLCMEVMEIDDLNFFPCSCGYQICRFCWHRIRTDENGLCPACRKAYSENPAMYQPLSQDEIHKIKKERKQREVQRKQKISESRKHLSNVRVIQKNLLFVVGLSQRLADAELLRKPDYFGKYGKILKVIVNPSTNYAGPQGPSASAYITYSKEEENLRAILAVNNIQQDGRTLRVSLGTTKYCTHFLRNLQCKNQDCMYLHEMGDDNACFTKDDMQQGKHLAYEKELLENFRQMQLTRRKSQDLEQESPNQKEDWGQEINEVNQNSALPAKAAWADKDSEKEVIEEYEQQQHQNDNSPSSTPWPSSDDALHTQDIPKGDDYSMPTSSFPNSSPSLGSSFPNEIIHPAFATGWATSEETKPVDQIPSILSEERSNSLYMAPSWPMVSDLGLKNLQVTNDDDLGFDPFEECNRGLADLLASEGKTNGVNNTAAPDLNWNQAQNDPFSDMNKEINTSQQYSLFGESMPGSQPNSLFGSYLSMSSENSSQSSVDNIMSPETLFSSLSPTKQYPNQKPRQNTFQKKEPDVLAWEDGLRALLPNVNISFSGKHLRRPVGETFGIQNTDQLNRNIQNTQLSRPPDPSQSRKPPWNDQSQASDPHNSQLSPEYGSLNAKRPPPGFESSPAKATAIDNPEAVWTRFVKEEKLKKQSPPGLVSQLSFPNQVIDAKSVPSSGLQSAENMSQPATPWNAVVGRGQQPPSGVQQMQDGISHLQMASRIPKDIADSAKVVEAKPSVKPVTSFNKVNGLNNQKPTAKVKPQMKFIVAEEFPPVNDSRNNLSASNSRSRMNDLDDISISDPLPLNRSLSGPAGFSGQANTKVEVAETRERNMDELETFQESTKKSSKKKKKSKEKQQDIKARVVPGLDSLKSSDKDNINIIKSDKNQVSSKNRKEKSAQNDKNKEEKMREPIKIQQRPKQAVVAQTTSNRPDPPKIRILKTETPSPTSATVTQSSPMEAVNKSFPAMQEGHEVFSRLAESTEKLLQTVLSETEVIKSNTEQISKDLKTALERCKESSLSVADLEKINYLLSTPMVNGHLQGKQQKSSIDTQDLERQVESARKEAEILEVRLNDVIRKNMAS